MSSTPLTSVTSFLKSGKGMAIALSTVAAVVLLFSIGQPEKPSANSTATSSGQPAAATASAPSGNTVPQTVATSFSSQQQDDIGQIIRNYLLKNPEILVEVSQALEEKRNKLQEERAQKVISENKKDIFRSPTDFVYGNPKGDITIVEYFDYNCGWCKRALDQVIEIAKKDPKVRVVMKEFPVFGGPPSITAAKAAMASIRQGKYWEYHVALMRQRRVNEATVFAVAEKVGLDVAKLKADMADPKIEAAIKKSIDHGRQMGIEATPGFLVDSRVNVGYLDAAQMESLVASIRKSGCKVC